MKGDGANLRLFENWKCKSVNDITVVFEQKVFEIRIATLPCLKFELLHCHAQKSNCYIGLLDSVFKCIKMYVWQEL